MSGSERYQRVQKERVSRVREELVLLVEQKRRGLREKEKEEEKRW